MNKQERYDICPRCGKHLWHIADNYELVSYKDQTLLGTEAECECGWDGMVLWQDPPYIGTVDFDELD